MRAVSFITRCLEPVASAALDVIADAGIARGDVKVFWSQIGIVNNEAAEKAKAARMNVVQNMCAMVEHRELIGE